MLNIIINFAKEKHGEQKYEDFPYFYHLSMVAQKTDKLINQKHFTSDMGDLFNLKKDLLYIAYLHDILEDTDCSIDDLADIGLSESIIDAINLLTKTKNYNYVTYIENIKQNKLAKIVKIADTLSNLEFSIKDCNYNFIKKYNKQLQLLLEKE